MSNRRGPSRLLSVVVIVALLAVGFVLGDSWLRGRAEQTADRELAAMLGTDHVTTQIGGWPFLATLLTDRLESVTLGTAGVPVAVGGRHATVDRIDAKATRLSPATDLTSAVAEQLDVSIVLNWDELSSLVGIPLSYAGTNRVAATAAVDLFGSRIEAAIEADFAVAASGQLRLTNPTASVAGVNVPPQILTAALDAFSSQLQLPTAAGLEYTELIGSEALLVARLQGHQVRLDELAELAELG